ncbi:IucA/IucC family protein [Paenibacillus phoenicis]|uniref:IucA/IucC family protein n=1 Tax=Paenibacillus phoenicis TaxID=554117 RepID=A0ABU5PRQ6_9BACL|nr:IucA/IucC family protein [Paenibacillus phoenicis]MEA3572605.1 IucA/IucC family protein [Paenibacillus phoenicis]
MHTMRTWTIESGRQAAELRIIGDLMNAFLTERFFRLDEGTFGTLSAAPEQIRRLYGGYGDNGAIRIFAGEIAFLVEDSPRLGVQWVQDSPIFKRASDGSWAFINSSAELAKTVLRAVLSEEAYSHPGVTDFLTGVEVAARQLALSLSPECAEGLLAFAPSSAYEWFIKGERIAALRDRPFHPSAKAKIGFTEQDCLKYSAEFGEPIRLRWVAVRADSVVRGCPEGPLSCLDLLAAEQRAAVEDEMQRRGLRPDEYVPLPVHPWQLQQVILSRFIREIEEGTIVVLDAEAGEFLATSSLRSLAPPSIVEVGSGADVNAVAAVAMLKLPVSVLSLGAARYLPVVKLLNGLAGEKLLRQAIACDDTLPGRVFLCEERHWWGYMPASMGLFDDHPRHLAAQLRLYPPELFEAERKVIPMSAFGVHLGGRHILSEILGKELSREEVFSFYSDLAHLFYDVVMRLFKIGIVPEIHGQNCCLVLERNQVKGLLLRDHDSVRLHQPYLDKHGIGDPGYRIRPGYSNSLYNETIHKLIFYVQSLGTQVNLASIMEALSCAYDLPESRLWTITEQAWKEALQGAGLPESDRAELYRAIFESGEWPVKLVVRPLLEADGVPGAMPSGKGTGHNPFLRGRL